MVMKNLKLIVSVLLLIFIIPILGEFSELAAKKKNVIKVLSIGNSFSEDAVENYLYELAEASGKEINYREFGYRRSYVGKAFG